MKTTKNHCKHSLTSVSAALGLVACLLACNTRAQYFTPPGSTVDGGSYSWDDPNWSASSSGTSPGPWTAGGFARFYGPGSYTVTVNNPESMAGMVENSSTSAATLTINAASSGSLSIVPNGSLTAGLPAQGFFTAAGENCIINAPITGTGGINTGNWNGTSYLYLYGNNTYSGGTSISSSYEWVYFNNNNSFGTGPICINGTIFCALFPSGGAPITLANSWTNVGSGTFGANFPCAVNTPLTCTGPMYLQASLNLRNSGDSTAPLTWSGAISGGGGLNLSANNSGTIILSGPNTYTGQTTIGAAGNSGVTVEVASLNKVSGGSASSSLGAPTTPANGTISIGGGALTSTLIYTGAGETSDRVINLAGTTGGATIENDGTGSITFGSGVTATGAGSKTLTLQGSDTGLNTVGGAIVDNSAVNKTSLVKAQAGTWRLSGVNTYTGETTVNAGTLEIAGSIAGNITVDGGVLQLDGATALTSVSATVSLAGALPDNSVILNFSGAQTVSGLSIGGVAQLTGTWGSPTSGADHTSSLFTGTGMLNVNGAPVITVQPQSVFAWPDSATTFTVTALGSPTYQWKHNGANVAGGNTSILTISPVEAADAGTYVCWLTNAFGWTNTADAVLTVLSTNAYTQIVRQDNPISYWRLDEAGGTVAHDYVGTNNGTYNNVILSQTPGYSTIDDDACVGLQKMPLGQGSFVSVANYNPFNFFTNANYSAPFTLEAWAYFTNVTGVQRLFSTDRSTAPGGYMFGISGANQLIFTTSAYYDYFIPLTSPLQPNVWYHLVVGSDGGTLYFFVNGEPVGSAYYLQVGGSIGGASGAPMCLGANGDFLSAGTRDNSEQLLGKLDECAIYGSYLGDYEIQQHYLASVPPVPVAQTPVADQPTNYVSLTTTFTENAAGENLHYQWYKNGLPVGSDSRTLILPNLQLSDAATYSVLVSNGGGSTNTPGATLTVLNIPTSPEQVGLTNGLVLHLPFDTDYKDISSRNNNGTNVNATTLPTDSPVVGGGYLHYSSAFGGPYNYVTLGKPSDLVFGESGNFSVAFWVRQNNYYTNLPFFGNATNSTARTSVGFALAPSLDNGNPSGGWAWSMYDGAIGFGAVGAAGSISDGNWHHLTFVFDRASTARAYLDGMFMDERNDSFFGSVDSGAVFNIGQDPTGMFDADATADIDDLGVWRRTLTQLEVSGMYLAGRDNTPGVSFAPAILAPPPTPTTISTLAAGSTTLSYSGGSGSRFVLLGTNNVAAPLANWTRIATNTSTPGSFTIPPVGSSAAPTFYRVQSE